MTNGKPMMARNTHVERFTLASMSFLLCQLPRGYPSAGSTVNRNQALPRMRMT